MSLDEIKDIEIRCKAKKVIFNLHKCMPDIETLYQNNNFINERYFSLSIISISIPHKAIRFSIEDFKYFDIIFTNHSGENYDSN